GVDSKREPEITVISQSVIEGSYFGETNNRFPILIGQALAQRLNVSIGEKVVLMTSDLARNINSGAFRVGGIFQTTSPDFDKAFVFLPQDQAQNLAGYGDGISAFTVRVDEAMELEMKAAEIKAGFENADIEVLSWKDRNKLLVLALKLYDFSIVIMVVILFVAIAFSIANAFLMVIYERIYEIGIMMANGVLPIKIRRMLYTEAIFIAALGTLLGLLVTALFVGYFAHYGLDLSAFAKGLGKFGVGSVVYPSVAPFDVIAGLITINLIVFLSVWYPSLKASRFEVVDAIRFV
ncbi:FtsX-like permease family protein, partial [bacterium]|nr:FtsX-like permease family protein [bacterium]